MDTQKKKEDLTRIGTKNGIWAENIFISFINVNEGSELRTVLTSKGNRTAPGASRPWCHILPALGCGCTESNGAMEARAEEANGRLKGSRGGVAERFSKWCSMRDQQQARSQLSLGCRTNWSAGAFSTVLQCLWLWIQNDDGTLEGNCE